MCLFTLVEQIGVYLAVKDWLIYFGVTVASQTHFKPQKMLCIQNIPHYISGAML